MKILILGSKEYPMGTNQGDDPQPSGGIEIYVDTLVKRLVNNKSLDFLIITRKFRETKAYEKTDNAEIYRVSWLRGFYLRNISFNFNGFLKALPLDFDLIFSQDIFATLFGVILSRIKRRPLIAVVHGIASNQPQYNPLLRQLLRGLEIFTFKRANLIISLSEKPKEKLENHLQPKVDWKVLPEKRVL
jgi:hypothetical protein